MDLLISSFLKRAQLPSKNLRIRMIKSPSKKYIKVLILHPLPFLRTSYSLKGCSWPLGLHFPARAKKKSDKSSSSRGLIVALSPKFDVFTSFPSPENILKLMFRISMSSVPKVPHAPNKERGGGLSTYSVIF